MPLVGRRIVVTRPEDQAAGLCEGIVRQGGEAVRFPVIGIAPVTDTSEMQALCDRLDRFDLAFFVSSNAVRHALSFVLARRAWPSSLRVATVGAASARALRENGFENVIAPETGFDSESVIALPEFRAEALRGKRLVIFRGDGGRDMLRDHARRHAAEVATVAAYRRYRPEADTAALECEARSGRLDALVFTSSEGVGNFCDLFKDMSSFDCMRALPVFAPHRRIASAARDRGFSKVVECAPGDDAILAALVRNFSS